MITKTYRGKFHSRSLRYLEINQNVQRVVRYPDKVTIIFDNSFEQEADGIMARAKYVDSIKKVEEVR